MRESYFTVEKINNNKKNNFTTVSYRKMLLKCEMFVILYLLIIRLAFIKHWWRTNVHWQYSIPAPLVQEEASLFLEILAVSVICILSLTFDCHQLRWSPMASSLGAALATSLRWLNWSTKGKGVWDHKGTVSPAWWGGQEKNERYLWLSILDGSGPHTHTILECILLGTDPEGGWAGNEITQHLLKANEKVSISSLDC
jgi:hypothetical protein